LREMELKIAGNSERIIKIHITSIKLIPPPPPEN